MKHSLLFALLLCPAVAFGSVVGSLAQFEAYSLAGGGPAMLLASRAALVGLEAVESGEARLLFWNIQTPPAPAQEDLLPQADADAYLVQHAVAAAQAAQDAKPLLRKTLENDFFDFTRLVLVAAGDPRKDADPTPKLGFEELTPLIEEIQVSNPMAAVNLTLKGLSIDSALKRFSATWWDDAQEHDIPVEE